MSPQSLLPEHVLKKVAHFPEPVDHLLTIFLGLVIPLLDLLLEFALPAESVLVPSCIVGPLPELLLVLDRVHGHFVGLEMGGLFAHQIL
jgi:hypothetical protein